jgi:hypothetical protein
VVVVVVGGVVVVKGNLAFNAVNDFGANFVGARPAFFTCCGERIPATRGSY